MSCICHHNRRSLDTFARGLLSFNTFGLAPEMLRIGNLLPMGTLSLEQFRPEATNTAFVPIRCLSPSLSSKMPGHIVIFSNDAKSRQAAVSAIESIALRLISTFPVRKIQGIFIDPISMGNSFPFKSLPKHIVGQQTYTRTDDVREQLRKLTVHTEQIIQNYLSRYYQSIEEYNAVKSAVEGISSTYGDKQTNNFALIISKFLNP